MVRDKGIHKDSDVDFIIEFSKGKLTIQKLMGIGDFPEDLLGRKFELIRPCALASLLRSHILNELENVTIGPVRLQHILETIEKSSFS